MPFLVRLLLILLAAAGACIALWAGLWSVGGEPRAFAQRVPSPEPPAMLEASVAPLARLGSPAEASARKSAPAPLPVAIALHGHATRLPLLLSVFDRWSGAPLAMVPIDAAAANAGSIDVVLPPGPHRVTLATDRAAARFGYLTAAPLDVPAGAQLALATGDVEVAVRTAAGSPAAGGVVVVERTDDPSWRAPHAGGALAITDASGLVRIGPLGAGRYRVSVRGGSSVELDFPATRKATLALGG